ncbi:MAG: VCBS repeat-containing protein [Acidobacteriota bacterium]|nr:VCBS repeat-containing protein [Acidobacteriota bacterium]
MSFRLWLVLILLGFTALPPAVAQPSFFEVTPAADPYFSNPASEDFWVNAVAPADVDGDGDLDLAVLGFYVVYNQSAEDRLVLLLNQGPGATGAWTFAPQQVPLGDVFAGGSDLAWGDYDGDGDHDLAVGSEGLTVLYRNDGGSLTALPNLFPGYFEDSDYDGSYDLRSLTWADADNDGDLDLLIPSAFDDFAGEYSTVLMRNDGPDGAGGWVFNDAAAGFAATFNAQSAWADDDGDGDLDLLLVDVDPFFGEGFVRRYENAAGSFTGTDLLPIRVEYGLADWGDYDADGDHDVLVAGTIEEADGTFRTVLRVYRSDAGVLTPMDIPGGPDGGWLDIHAATWADYDSDGDVDLLATGSYIGPQEIEGRSTVYANNGGVLSDVGVELPAPIGSVGRGGAFTWLDIDGDEDLDYLVAGAYYVPAGNGLVEARMHLYRNDVTAANAAPAPPAGLTATTRVGGAMVEWTGATDDSTPALAITYDLEVRRVGGGGASAERLPEPGGVSAATRWPLNGLLPGTYSWTVRAVDSSFSDSAPAGGNFTVEAAEEIFSSSFETGDTQGWIVGPP